MKWAVPGDAGFTASANGPLLDLLPSLDLPSEMKAHLASTTRPNHWGHCEFGPGELERLTGLSANAVRHGISEGIKHGLFRPGSTPRCVVIISTVYQDGRGGARLAPCGHSKHREFRERHWLGGDRGEVPSRVYDELLADDPVMVLDRIKPEIIAVVNPKREEFLRQREQGLPRSMRSRKRVPTAPATVMTVVPECVEPGCVNLGLNGDGRCDTHTLPLCWQDGCTEPRLYGRLCVRHAEEEEAERVSRSA
jgi:hypothetical protein